MQPKGSHYHCSGSLIADRWVLTARHCLADDRGKKFPASAYTVMLNGSRYGVTGDGVRGWSPPGPRGDVALLKLTRGTKAAIAKPLPLAPSPRVAASFVNRGVTYFGFGLLKPKGSFPSSPQKTPNGSYRAAPHCSFGAGTVCFLKSQPYSKDHVAVLGGDSGGPWVAWEGGSWLQIAVEKGGVSENAPTSIGPEGGPSVGLADVKAWLTSNVGRVLAPEIGHIVRNPSTRAAWLVAGDGFRRWIPTGQIYNCLVRRGAKVDSRDQFDIEAIPDRVGSWASCTDPPPPDDQPPPDDPPPPPPQSIQIGWSGGHPGWIWMALNGFSVGQHQYTCAFGSGGNRTFTLTETTSPQSWDNGHTCYDLIRGDTVWVVVDGVASNTITVP